VEAVERYLNSFGKSVVNKSKGILKRKNKVVTGNLLNSINFRLVKNQDFISVEFSMLDYGQFIDKGTSGTKKERTYIDYKGKKRKSPYAFGKSRDGGLTRGIDKWIVMRGIAPRDAKGRFISRKSLKFLIARKIYTQGHDGLSFFQKPLGLEFRGFAENVGKAIKEDIINNLKQ
tara:strand:- start:545 stop:1066 length:522 start_codon:yes stop_codon:yes gene_type:complete